MFRSVAELKMIKKINQIKNILSYSFFNWDKINPTSLPNTSGVPVHVPNAFKKTNIFFGENGSGKSNLIKIFKSINESDGRLLEKNRDLSSDQQKITIAPGNGSDLEYDGVSWTDESLKDKFLFFDKHFIEQYVHSVGFEEHNTPERKQQRGGSIIYLGNFVKYNEEINKINEIRINISTKNDRFLTEVNNTIDNTIKTYNSANDTNIALDELNLSQSEVQKHIKSLNIEKLSELRKNYNNKKEELNKIRKAIEEESNLLKLTELDKITQSLSLTIEIITIEGEKQIRQIDPHHLFSFTVSSGVEETLQNISSKKDFVETGVKLIKEGGINCPFCEQKIKNGDYLPIIKQYQQIFDKSFDSRKQEIINDLTAYKKLLEGLRDLQPPNSNKERFTEAEKYLSSIKEPPDCSLGDNDKQIIKDELILVDEKEKNILKQISGSKVEEIGKIIKKAKMLIMQYNNAVSKINTEIAALKEKATKGDLTKEEEQLTQEISDLEREILYTSQKDEFLNYFYSIEVISMNKKVIQSLEIIYQRYNDEIVREFKNFTDKYFNTIKDFIKNINSSMEIFDIVGEPKYDRRGKEIAQCAFEIRYKDEDCSHTLSEGEKQTIALAFFLAHLNQDPDKNKIVIFDDPITSFDAGKRKSTANLIEKQTKSYEQTFIFTCDPLFRTFCAKEMDNRNLYYILMSISSSAIHYIPKNRETIFDSFETDFKLIDGYNGTDENIVIFGQKLRFCLETKIKDEYFGYSEDSFDHILNSVNRKGVLKYKDMISKIPKIKEIYKYCNTAGFAHYPKDGATTWNELKHKIKEYLSLQL